MTGKYTTLENYLHNLPEDLNDVILSFEKLEQILNDLLPPSAIRHRPWWSNEAKGSHVQAHAWLNAGWKVETVNFNQKWVHFIRA